MEQSGTFTKLPVIKHSLMQELETKLTTHAAVRDKCLRDTDLGDILEVFYDPQEAKVKSNRVIVSLRVAKARAKGNGELFANLSPSADFRLFPDPGSEAFRADPHPIFVELKSHPRSPHIRFDSSWTLFFNPLMKSSQIDGLVKSMADEDRLRIEIVAICESLLYGPTGVEVLNILAGLPYLRRLKIVAETPSEQKPALGPRANPPDKVEFFMPSSDVPASLLPYSPIDLLMDVQRRVQAHCAWAGRTLDLEFVRVKRNSIMSDSDYEEFWQEEVRRAKELEDANRQELLPGYDDDSGDFYREDEEPEIEEGSQDSDGN